MIDFTDTHIPPFTPHASCPNFPYPLWRSHDDPLEELSQVWVPVKVFSALGGRAEKFPCEQYLRTWVLLNFLSNPDFRAKNPGFPIEFLSFLGEATLNVQNTIATCPLELHRLPHETLLDLLPKDPASLVKALKLDRSLYWSLYQNTLKPIKLVNNEVTFAFTLPKNLSPVLGQQGLAKLAPDSFFTPLRQHFEVLLPPLGKHNWELTRLPTAWFKEIVWEESKIDYEAIENDVDLQNAFTCLRKTPPSERHIVALNVLQTRLIKEFPIPDLPDPVFHLKHAALVYAHINAYMLCTTQRGLPISVHKHGGKYFVQSINHYRIDELGVDPTYILFSLPKSVSQMASYGVGDKQSPHFPLPFDLTDVNIKILQTAFKKLST